MKDVKDIEGVVTEVCYYNKLCGFSEPPLNFNLNGEHRITYYLTGKNKPPILKGMYVTGKAGTLPLIDDVYGVRVVEELQIHDKKKKHLASYKM